MVPGLLIASLIAGGTVAAMKKDAEEKMKDLNGGSSGRQLNIAPHGYAVLESFKKQGREENISCVYITNDLNDADKYARAAAYAMGAAMKSTQQDKASVKLGDIKDINSINAVKFYQGEVIDFENNKECEFAYVVIKF